MPLTPPPPVITNPFARMYHDLRLERAATEPFPPGLTNVDLRRAAALRQHAPADPARLYERFGPVFTLRIFHGNVVFMLGPEANHYMTVSHAANFSWRDGHMGDLIPLLGDGLLTIDGDFHRRAAGSCCPPSTASASRPRTRSCRGDAAALDRVSAPARARSLSLDARAGAADRDARAVRAGPRPGAGRGSTPRTSSRRPWASGRATTCCRSCAGPGRLGGGWWRLAGGWTR